MGLYDYADLDCMNIVIHHYFKWLKFGFNRITDNASNEIRKGRITRPEAVKLVQKKDGVKPPIEYIEKFCEQINISVEEFWKVVKNLEIKTFGKRMITESGTLKVGLEVQNYQIDFTLKIVATKWIL